MYAEVTDLEARWRPLTPDESVRAAVLLEDAAVRLDAACPPSDPPTVQELAARKIVSCEMIKRSMAAGVDAGAAGITSLQMGAGPYQETRQFANPTGDLYLAKGDKLLLGCGKSQAFTVPMSNDADYVPPWGVS